MRDVYDSDRGSDYFLVISHNPSGPFALSELNINEVPGEMNGNSLLLMAVIERLQQQRRSRAACTRW